MRSPDDVWRAPRPPRHRRTVTAVLGAVIVVLVAVAAYLIAVQPRREPPPPTLPASRVRGVDELPVLPAGQSWAPRPRTIGGLRAVATAGPDGFALYTAGGRVTFLPGVNLGGTTPGHQPGELAIAAEDYRSWFDAMDRLGIRVVRNYTIHPPAFYAELLRHNRARPTRPLYLIQGVYLPDESYVHDGDLYDRALTAAFTGELRDASAAVRGRLSRPVTPGRASGTWTADVSDWTAAWIVGVEWEPAAVLASDRVNAAAPAYTGRFFVATAEASPTERWLAARMDELATALAGHGRSVPIAFVNWPTTDPLRHPDEPLRHEDLVGVDANRVRPTAYWPGGTFASYHAYPYYPDFQRYEPDLQRFRYAGRVDPYAGYLDALRRHHAPTPVMLTEFGVPSSLGSAHAGPLGRDQGGHDEREAMRIDAEILRMARDLGLAGGLLFSWVDEWFKVSWNTAEHQVPERRQLWHDVLTNEQHFGLIATDPAGAINPDPITLSGSTGAPRATARVDEAYLHLAIGIGDEVGDRFTIALDTLPELAGAPAPGCPDRRADAAFAFNLATGTGQAWIRAELDPTALDRVEADLTGAAWRPYRLVINRALTVPTTGQRQPAEYAEVGVLRQGTWEPGEPGADSRNVWRRDGDQLVVRIPWGLAGFADPSARRVLVPRGGSTGTEVVAGVDVLLCSTARATARATATTTTTVTAAAVVDRLVGRLTWQDWQRVGYAERLKEGALSVRDAMIATAGDR